MNFKAQVDDGGVYQFLFNYPELAIIALQAMEILEMDKLCADYAAVLNEYFGEFENIQDLRSQFSNKSKDWNAFADGYKEIKKAGTIESYFYSKDFQKEYQSLMYDFVKKNKDQLFISK